MKSELFSWNHLGKDPDIVVLYTQQKQYKRLYPLGTNFCLLTKKSPSTSGLYPHDLCLILVLRGHIMNRKDNIYPFDAILS